MTENIGSVVSRELLNSRRTLQMPAQIAPIGMVYLEPTEKTDALCPNYVVEGIGNLRIDYCTADGRTVTICGGRGDCLTLHPENAFSQEKRIEEFYNRSQEMLKKPLW